MAQRPLHLYSKSISLAPQRFELFALKAVPNPRKGLSPDNLQHPNAPPQQISVRWAGGGPSTWTGRRRPTWGWLARTRGLPVLLVWAVFILILSDGRSFQWARSPGWSRLSLAATGNSIICYICFPNRGIKSHLPQSEARHNVRPCGVCVYVRVLVSAT